VREADRLRLRQGLRGALLAREAAGPRPVRLHLRRRRSRLLRARRRQAHRQEQGTATRAPLAGDRAFIGLFLISVTGERASPVAGWLTGGPGLSSPYAVSRQLELLLVYHECGSFGEVVGTSCQMPIASGHCTALHLANQQKQESQIKTSMLTCPQIKKKKERKRHADLFGATVHISANLGNT